MTKTDNSVVWINVIDDGGVKIWLNPIPDTKSRDYSIHARFGYFPINEIPTLRLGKRPELQGVEHMRLDKLLIYIHSAEALWEGLW